MKTTPATVTAGQAQLLTASGPAKVYQSVHGKRVLIKELKAEGYTTFIPSADSVEVETDSTFILLPTSAHVDSASTDTVSNTIGADLATLADGKNLYERKFLPFDIADGEIVQNEPVTWTAAMPCLKNAERMFDNCTNLVSFKPEGGLTLLEDATSAWIGCGLREFICEMPCVRKLNAAFAYCGQLKHIGVYDLPMLEDAYNAFAFTYLPKSEIIRLVGILPNLEWNFNTAYDEAIHAGLNISAKNIKERGENVLDEHAFIIFSSEFGALGDKLKGGAYELVADSAAYTLLEDYARSKGWKLYITADNGEAKPPCAPQVIITGDIPEPKYTLTYAGINFYKTVAERFTGTGAWAHVNLPFNGGDSPADIAAALQTAIGGNTIVGHRQTERDIILDIFSFDGVEGAAIGINDTYGVSAPAAPFDGHIHREGEAV